VKLFVTMGTRDGGSEEKEFEFPDGEYITWMGVEIEDTRPEDQRGKTGRMTIIRVPFVNHEPGMHTICTLNGEIHQVVTA
jgi:hypothetical protein